MALNKKIIAVVEEGCGERERKRERRGGERREKIRDLKKFIYI